MYSLILGSILTIAVASAQRPQADTFETKSGDITVQPILHGTLALYHQGKVIYVDPYGGEKAFEGIPDPDLVLITDIHGDHLNEQTLESLDLSNASIIAPQAVTDQMSDKYKELTKIIGNGEETEFNGWKILAMPMYNLPEAPDEKHVKGRGNGYVLEIDGMRIYISGDTEDIPEMRNLQDIDLAFVCMNLPYTMNIEQAASAVLEFKPKVVYPFHYRGNPDMSDTQAFKELVDQGGEEIEVRLRNWYPEY